MRPKFFFLFVLLAAGTLVLSACSPSSLHKRDLFLQPEAETLPENAGRLKQHEVLSVRWRVKLMEVDARPVEQHHHGAPAVSQDGLRVFVGSYDGAFYAIDSNTGKVLWRKLTKAKFAGSSLAADGLVFAGATSGEMFAFRESDGQIMWTHRSQAAVEGMPVLAGDRLLFMTNTNQVICLDAQTGEWRWSYKRDVPTGRFQVQGVCDPLVHDDQVYVGFSDGFAARLNLQDGSVQAVRRLSKSGARFSDVDGSPLMVDDTVVMTEFSSGVLALDPQSLEERWSHQVEGASRLVRNGGLLFYSSSLSNVEALRVKDAELQWRFKAGKGSLSHPVLAGDWLLVSSGEHSLLVLDQATGKLLQIFNPGKGSGSPPAVVGQKVFWLSNGQILYGMRLAG